MILPFPRFLSPLPSADPPARVLLVQSGSPQLLLRAVDGLRTQLPDSQLTVLLQRDMRGLVQERPDVEYLDNQGPKPAFVSSLRARRFSAAYVLFSNEPGFWKLKLLPFAIGAGAVFALNENLDSFPVDLKHGEQLARHLRWRLESSVTFSGDGHSKGLEALLKAAAYPAALAWLFAYERLREARRTGGTGHG